MAYTRSRIQLSQAVVNARRFDYRDITERTQEIAINQRVKDSRGFDCTAGRRVPTAIDRLPLPSGAPAHGFPGSHGPSKPLVNGGWLTLGEGCESEGGTRPPGRGDGGGPVWFGSANTKRTGETALNQWLINFSCRADRLDPALARAPPGPECWAILVRAGAAGLAQGCAPSNRRAGRLRSPVAIRHGSALNQGPARSRKGRGGRVWHGWRW
jgi:hypothetical protein